MTIPPAGYDVDNLNQLVMTSDESVAHGFRTVFAKLASLRERSLLEHDPWVEVFCEEEPA